MRACWLKWVGRDWSISADYIWLNYSGANMAEMRATGTSTRKVQRVAEKMGIGRLGRGRVGTIAVSLDAEIADLAEGRSRCARYP